MANGISFDPFGAIQQGRESAIAMDMQRQQRRLGELQLLQQEQQFFEQEEEARRNRQVATYLAPLAAFQDRAAARGIATDDWAISQIHTIRNDPGFAQFDPQTQNDILREFRATYIDPIQDDLTQTGQVDRLTRLREEFGAVVDPRAVNRQLIREIDILGRTDPQAALDIALNAGELEQIDSPDGPERYRVRGGTTPLSRVDVITALGEAGPDGGLVGLYRRQQAVDERALLQPQVQQQRQLQNALLASQALITQGRVDEAQQLLDQALSGIVDLPSRSATAELAPPEAIARREPIDVTPTLVTTDEAGLPTGVDLGEPLPQVVDASIDEPPELTDENLPDVLASVIDVATDEERRHIEEFLGVRERDPRRVALDLSGVPDAGAIFSNAHLRRVISRLQRRQQAQARRDAAQAQREREREAEEALREMARRALQ